MTSRELFEALIEDRVGCVDVEPTLRTLTNGYQHDLITLLLDDLEHCYLHYIGKAYSKYIDGLYDWYENELAIFRSDISAGIERDVESIPIAPDPMGYVDFEAGSTTRVYSWAIDYLKSKLESDVPRASTDDLPGVDKLTDEQAERTSMYLKKAIDAGLMKRTSTGFEWTYGGTARLGYFVSKVYPKYETPIKWIEEYFGVDRIGSAIYQIDSAKKPQPWRSKIDKIFEVED